VITVYDYTAND